MPRLAIDKKIFFCLFNLIEKNYKLILFMDAKERYIF